VQQHAASFIAHTAASTGSALLRFSKEEFDAFLECGILAHVIPQVPVRQWVLSLPIPLRLASLPRSPNWSRRCCSAWPRGTCWTRA
jgi:hypothetical protein